MVTKGTFVKITYTGRVKETGELFDTTDIELAKREGAYNPRMHYGSVTIVAGEGKLVAGLDEALQDMKIGEERALDVPPEKGFGPRSADLLKLIPLKEFNKQGFTPQQGMPITMNGVRGRVVSVNSGRVRVDFNHPLAGKTLAYVVRAEEQVDDKTKQAQGIVDFYLSEKADVTIVKDDLEIVHKQEIAQKTKEAIAEDVKKYVGVANVKFTQPIEPKKEASPANPA